MSKFGARIKHPKLRGEWAELCFMVRAAEKGLRVSKPWGETAHYDFVVEGVERFVRVQVKSTISKRGTGYACKIRDCHGGPYRGNPFDFVAAYLILEDIWYIIPVDEVRGKASVGLYPRLAWSKYEPYRGAWHLLRGEERRAGRVDEIEACADTGQWLVGSGRLQVLLAEGMVEELACPPTQNGQRPI